MVPWCYRTWSPPGVINTCFLSYWTSKLIFFSICRNRLAPQAIFDFYTNNNNYRPQKWLWWYILQSLSDISEHCVIISEKVKFSLVSFQSKFNRGKGQISLRQIEGFEEMENFPTESFWFDPCFFFNIWLFSAPVYQDQVGGFIYC